MRFRIVLMACAMLALAVGVASATAGDGNSDAAKDCQQGGWQNWVRADHTAFKNVGDCVSYAAQRGVLTSPTSQAQLDCEAAGGTFSTDPSTDQLGMPGTVAWTCNNVAVSQGSAALEDDCFAVALFFSYNVSAPPWYATCWTP